MASNPRIDELRRRLEKEPTSRLFAQLAEELRKDGALEEAVRVCRDGLQRHPAYPSARMTLGRALLDMGDLGAARVEFDAVLKSAPDNILASRFLGECLEGLGDLEGARSRYQSTLLLAPGDKQVMAQLAALEARLRAGAAAGRPVGAGREAAPPAVDDETPPPIPLSPADESFELEQAHEPAATRPSTLTPSAPEPPVEWAGSWEGSPGTSEGPAPEQGLPAGVEDGFEIEPIEEAAAAESDAPLVEAGPEPSPEPAPSDEMFDIERIEEALASAWEGPSAAAPARPQERAAPPVEFSFDEEGLPEATATSPAEAAPAEAHGDLASPTLAELYFDQGSPELAIEVYRRLLRREPGNQRALQRVAELERMMSQAAERAPSGEPDPRARRREVVERTIGRLEGLLSAIRRG